MQLVQLLNIDFDHLLVLRLLIAFFVGLTAFVYIVKETLHQILIFILYLKSLSIPHWPWDTVWRMKDQQDIQLIKPFILLISIKCILLFPLSLSSCPFLQFCRLSKCPQWLFYLPKSVFLSHSFCHPYSSLQMFVRYSKQIFLLHPSCCFSSILHNIFHLST